MITDIGDGCSLGPLVDRQSNDSLRIGLIYLSGFVDANPCKGKWCVVLSIYYLDGCMNGLTRKCPQHHEY